MSNIKKPISVRLTQRQISYLDELSSLRSKPHSELIRDLIQEKMEQKSNEQTLLYILSFVVKIYQLLKEYLRTYHEQSKETIEAAENSANDILDALDQKR